MSSTCSVSALVDTATMESQQPWRTTAWLAQQTSSHQPTTDIATHINVLASTHNWYSYTHINVLASTHNWYSIATHINILASTHNWYSYTHQRQHNLSIRTKITTLLLLLFDFERPNRFLKGHFWKMLKQDFLLDRCWPTIHISEMTVWTALSTQWCDMHCERDVFSASPQCHASAQNV